MMYAKDGNSGVDKPIDNSVIVLNKFANNLIVKFGHYSSRFRKFVEALYPCNDSLTCFTGVKLRIFRNIFVNLINILVSRFYQTIMPISFSTNESLWHVK